VSSKLPLALLPLACLLAFVLREGAAGPGAERWPLDAESAMQMRRVELALASGSVRTFDRFIDSPRGAQAPSPPFFPVALAAVAEFGLRDFRVESELGGVEEGALERWLSHTGPLLAALIALGVGLVVLAASRGEGRGLAAVIGATLFALWPGAIEAGAAGRLDVGGAQALLLVWGLAILALTSTARDNFDWLQGGMTAGLMAGLALVTGAHALVTVPFLWAGFYILSRRGAEDERGAARRAGLFFVLVAAVVTSFAAGRTGSPGAATDWVRGSSELVFAGAAPFLIAGLGKRTRRGRWTTWTWIAGVAVAVGLLPFAALHLSGALTPDLLALATVGGISLERLPLILGFLVGAWFLGDLDSAPWGKRGWILLAGVLVVGGLVAPAFTVPAAAAVSILLALAWTTLGRRAQSVTAVGALALLAAPLILQPGAEDRSTAHDLVRALRRLREETPAPGPWNAPSAPPDYSVLAPWTLGHLIAYHGRRAPSASGFGPGLGAEQAREAASILVSPEGEGAALRARALGARYVLAGAAAVAEWPAVQALTDGGELEASLLWALTSGAAGTPFELVFEAGRVEVEGGDQTHSIPLLALYRIDLPTGTPDEPSIRAR